MSAADNAGARVAMPVTLAHLARSAARVVRGRCLAAEPGMVEVAGARLTTTTYTFDVAETLKGAAAGTLVFRQVGTHNGGPRDLGARVGLPTYAPGLEYVLFLLPESAAGLTSPAGAAQGAFLVQDERALPLNGPVYWETPPAGARPAIAPPRPDVALAYEVLRRAVRAQVAP